MIHLFGGQSNLNHVVNVDGPIDISAFQTNTDWKLVKDVASLRDDRPELVEMIPLFSGRDRWP